MWGLGRALGHTRPPDGTAICHSGDVRGCPFHPRTTFPSPAAHLCPPGMQGGAPLPGAGYEASIEMLQGAKQRRARIWPHAGLCFTGANASSMAGWKRWHVGCHQRYQHALLCPSSRSHCRPQQPSRERRCLCLAKQLPLRGRGGSPAGRHGPQCRARGSLNTLRVPVRPVSAPMLSPAPGTCQPPPEQLAGKGEEGKIRARLVLSSASAL